MISKPLGKENLEKLSLLIENSSNMVITCHVKPDGDAIGSTLALMQVLSKLGKHVDIITPDSPPKYLRFLPGFKEIIHFSAKTDLASRLLEEADIIFCLDFNAAYRVDKMQDSLLNSKAKKVLIDHHLDPEAFADITISSPSDSSTCLLIFKVLCQLGLRPLIEKPEATCIAAGMMTDTGNFSYNANDPEAYTVIAELLLTGIDKVAIWDKLNVRSEAQLRLNGFALSEKLKLISDDRASLIQLSKEELSSHSYQKGDLEGLVNVPLQIPEVEISVLMHEEATFIKVSMRSQGKIPVNEICEKYFGGGGHLNAAGGEFKGTLEEAATILENILPDYYPYFRKKLSKEYHEAENQ